MASCEDAWCYLVCKIKESYNDSALCIYLFPQSETQSALIHGQWKTDSSYQTAPREDETLPIPEVSLGSFIFKLRPPRNKKAIDQSVTLPGHDASESRLLPITHQQSSTHRPTYNRAPGSDPFKDIGFNEPDRAATSLQTSSLRATRRQVEREASREQRDTLSHTNVSNTHLPISTLLAVSDPLPPLQHTESVASSSINIPQSMNHWDSNTTNADRSGSRRPRNHARALNDARGMLQFSTFRVILSYTDRIQKTT